MSFTFGAQPQGTSLFGQAPAFGAQQPFSAPTTVANTTPQFVSAFGGTAQPTALQFGSSTAPSLFGQQPGLFSSGAAVSTAATTFGTPSLFGAAASTPNTGFTLGTAVAPPAFGAAAATAFGAAAAPAFGTAAAPTFATAAAAPAFGTAATSVFGTAAPTAFGTAAPTAFGTMTAPTFGTVTAPAFGTAATAPTFGSTGLTFGAAATTAPAFGAPASSAPGFGLGSTFGTPASTQSSALTFGTSAAAPFTASTFGAPATSIAFGNFSAVSAPSTSVTFGAPAAAVPTFGTQANLGLNFGSTPITTSLNIATATPFNVTPTTSKSTGFPVGSTSSAPNLLVGTTPALNLGNSSTTTGLTFAPPTTASFSLASQPGTTAVPTTNLTFNAPSAISSSGVTFAAPTTNKATGGLTFGTPTLSLGTTTGTTTVGVTSTPLSFNTFLTSPATTTTSRLGPTTSTAIATTSIGFGGAGITKATATSVPLQFGLGGVAVSTSKHASASATVPQGELPPRDQPLPNELVQTIDLFKAFIKEQKTNSSEIARFSMKELKNVEANITNINHTINELENDMQKNKCTAEKLKLDTAQALHFAEMAQRTFEIPAGMQYDNSAPIQFFVQLLQNFERDLQQLRFHIEMICKQVKNDNATTILTPEDLGVALRRVHYIFVTLAGHVQIVHNRVEMQKSQYLKLRKDILNDTSNIFENQNKELEALEYTLKYIANENKLPEVIAGPSPFNSLGTGQAQLLAQNLPPVYPATSPGQTTFGTPTASGINSKPIFGGVLGDISSLFNSPTPSTTNSFQLQKPPTGSKRGKT